MSNNIQVIQNLYGAFGRGDLPAILELLAPEIDWHFVGQPQDIPFAGQRHGHAQVTEFFTLIAQTIEILEFEAHEFLAFEDKVLVLGHSKARVRATRRIFRSDWNHLYTVRAGKIVQLKEFYDTATMAAAFHPSAGENEGLSLNKDIAQQLYAEVISGGNWQVADELLHSNLADYSNPPGWPEGREGAKQNIGYIRSAFSGWRFTPEAIIAEGDKVVLRGTFQGTHTGEFFGIQPTGRPVTISGTHVLTVREGKVTEHWANNDDLSLMRQLGVIPEPESVG
jgi:ketosteroid isomerase-like protein